MEVATHKEAPHPHHISEVKQPYPWSVKRRGKYYYVPFCDKCGIHHFDHARCQACTRLVHEDSLSANLKDCVWCSVAEE